MNQNGTLHLVPVGLGDAPASAWLPADVQALAGGLSVYIAENAKTARAFLKLIGTTRPLQEISIHTLSPKTDLATMRQWLAPLSQGINIGLVSEAGCPAVADPGARVVSLAHDLGYTVAPWVGPSSILLGLMASGLDGQRFAFHGYAPVNPAERAKQLKAWEATSQKQHQTQLLIETPYRNDAMLDTLVQSLKGNTRLCVARALTTPQQWILTAPISRWKTLARPQLSKLPTLFLFQATNE
jgi:16S rRNA (cytidine1402-2'-O)-methyltransferase